MISIIHDNYVTIYNQYEHERATKAVSIKMACLSNGIKMYAIFQAIKKTMHVNDGTPLPNKEKNIPT